MNDPKRLAYVILCALILASWIAVGSFETAEAPYVQF